MASHRQTALDCATRIANTMLLNNLIGEQGVSDKILVTADKFAAWLGPDPAKQFGGQKQEKPTFDKPCPVCQSEMYDNRASKKNPSAPDARCKKAGKWNAAENRYEGCQGVRWPEEEKPA